MSLPSLGCCADDRDGQLGADQFAELVEDLVFVAVGDARVVLGLKLRCGEEAGDALPLHNKAALVGLFNHKLKWRLSLTAPRPRPR
jgi:hypothetical protein